MSWSDVKRVWKELHKNPEARKQLRPEIYDSWERCYSYQVPQFLRNLTSICSPEEFKKACEDSKYLMENAIPVMNRLSEFVKGTGFVVGLNDANCVALSVIGDKEATEWSQRTNVVAGLISTEDKVGTNGLPLSVSLAKPISVCSYEHFCLSAVTTTSSFAPIINNGRVVGSIGLIAPYERIDRHTLGMVVMAADHIQSTMILNRVSNYHQVITDSITDGVMVVDLSGSITYLNKSCQKMLGLENCRISNLSVQSVFGKNIRNEYFINMVTRGQETTDNLMHLYLGKRQISCHITCTPLYSSNPADAGSVVIIRESEQMNRIVGKWIGGSAKMTFDNIIGENTRFREIINIAQSASQSDSNVLLLGESGTGKDIIAQAMHNNSPRRNNPYLAINCAALPRELIASELFGYEEGAFTGARKGGNIGKFELANQGTLFLDEIGDMPIDLQASLLRVLEEKSIIRLGGNKLIPVNIRIIAATNKNLENEIACNRFRRDLYYRLGVIRIVIPPLRERADDIPLLIRHFLKVICKRYGKSPKTMSANAVERLTDYPWPGNIRELQNVLEGGIQLAAGERIDYSLIAHYLEPDRQSPQVQPQPPSGADIDFTDERMLLEYTLKKHFYNKTNTARALGISRQSLYKRMKKYNMKTD
ncbi:Transcriptional regulator containing PAS, AAA-type ATPase, and DNA-binding Fis domains [Papillibacter cinnamivorans DSM 12816]|uniref:Transcriptional regulator containing PAS, AAA-type ATPase, and DNA-binding Fis domains n=2 Tax=Papillibacter TaxID=100175 RepID=A0A1W2CC89_9FIRM|nr:Transcriptional regulator containing PAS, AAA-type ATPase, and DNA-binding Fis domains [Papillibacter cinnamivorans DSM 12816]